MKATTLKTLRRVHLYVAVFFTPAIIFFAFSGMLQTYSFHEPSVGEPPAWIATIASLHKHQRLPQPKPAPAAGHDEDHAPGARPKPAAPAEPASTAALKLFTGLTGLGLVVASLLGLAVALGTRSTRRISAIVLLVGLVLPVALVLA